MWHWHSFKVSVQQRMISSSGQRPSSSLTLRFLHNFYKTVLFFFPSSLSQPPTAASCFSISQLWDTHTHDMLSKRHCLVSLFRHAALPIYTGGRLLIPPVLSRRHNNFDPRLLSSVMCNVLCDVFFFFLCNCGLCENMKYKGAQIEKLDLRSEGLQACICSLQYMSFEFSKQHIIFCGWRIAFLATMIYILIEQV